MRLWHKDLIPVLPDKQLLGQWRECCAIARNIAEKGSPNHILVNKIMDYPLEHFLRYGELVNREMLERGFRPALCRFSSFLDLTDCNFGVIVKKDDLFQGWHNFRYLTQCIFNLQEKYDCGGISEEEYAKILELYSAEVEKEKANATD